MPISFPLSLIGNRFDDFPLKYRQPFPVVPAPNLSRPGLPLTANALAPGGPWPLVATNVQRLGTMYAAVQSTAAINMVNTPFTDRLVYDRVLSQTRHVFDGVSRDNTGAVLGNCQVLVFRTVDKLLEAETISDGSGVWSVTVSQGRQYFFVEYKVGVPDVFGTSLNDRVPTQV